MSNLKDVAQMAGVSVATVSRVINNGPNIKDETQAQVRQAMKALNYFPGRISSRSRSKAVSFKRMAVLVPDINNPFYIDILAGIEEYLEKHDYLLFICNFSQDAEKAKRYLVAMVSESVDGLIVAPVHEEDEGIRTLESEGIPYVCIDRDFKDSKADLVLVDNETGAYEAVRFLLSQGYRRIAYISGLKQIPTSRQREAGYIRALAEDGIPFRDELVKYGDSTLQSGIQLSAELMSHQSHPDAIFTGNNLITLGALETIKKSNLRIPEDIGLLGFDDMPFSSSLNPPLTAVCQPAYEMGRRAAELLHQRITEPGRPRVKVLLETKLNIRESTRHTNN
jgi:DNA-binding LacI/PurR family transcriptional regulator